MTLGRPCVVRKNRVSLPRELEPTSTAEEQQLDYTFHIQSIKLHSILGDILFKVYEPLTDDAGFITVNPAVFKVLNEPHCTNSIVEIDSAMLRFWESVPKDLQLESSSAVSDSVKKRQAVALRAR